MHFCPFYQVSKKKSERKKIKKNKQTNTEPLFTSFFSTKGSKMGKKLPMWANLKLLALRWWKNEIWVSAHKQGFHFFVFVFVLFCFVLFCFLTHLVESVEHIRKTEIVCGCINIHSWRHPFIKKKQTKNKNLSIFEGIYKCISSVANNS